LRLAMDPPLRCRLRFQDCWALAFVLRFQYYFARPGCFVRLRLNSLAPLPQARQQPMWPLETPLLWSCEPPNCGFVECKPLLEEEPSGDRSNPQGGLG